MDMGGMTMSPTMAMPMATTTTTAAAVTTTAINMSDMDMGGMGENAHHCKISMLWNWNTIDACFLSPTWHIKSQGMFAGSCIGVILLTIVLEVLRRAAKEYDRSLIKKHAQHVALTSSHTSNVNDANKANQVHEVNDSDRPFPNDDGQSPSNGPVFPVGYRPKLLEQAIRALLHTAQFIVAYFLMLLAMYYNGYIILCIFIGAYIGSFIFQWETLGGGKQTNAVGEVTVCCG